MCNQIIKPEFTKGQIAECQSCKHASERKLWCCLFGVSIVEAGTIITPAKEIHYPSLPKMAGSFARAGIRHVASGLQNRTKDEQRVVIEICKQCDSYVIDSRIGARCSKCGCCLNLKTRWATAHCPVNKW